MKMGKGEASRLSALVRYCLKHPATRCERGWIHADQMVYDKLIIVAGERVIAANFYRNDEDHPCACRTDSERGLLT